MTLHDVLNDMKSKFPYIETSVLEEQQGRIHVSKDHFLNILVALQNAGFEQLASVFAIDWIDDGEFEVNYNVGSYEHKLNVIVKVRIPREDPKIPTCQNIWEVGQVYEREVHEFFGVEFIGNPDLSPMILHNWRDLPPLRKDFITKQYSEKAFHVGTREGVK